jgi:phosphoribosylanthranilate isomerase
LSDNKPLQLHFASPSRVRVKVCGITSVADALLAASLGVDAIGVVFYEPSPRCVTVDMAAAIARAVGPFVTVTGLFVDADRQAIEHVLSHVPLQLLQFHGDESARFCEQFSRPYLKAIRMRDDLDIGQAMAAYPTAAGILLDTYRQGIPGGTGEVFDWQRVPNNNKQPIILAGGLRPANVRAAIIKTNPYGVDVSGGVESSPGKKEYEKIAALMAEVHSLSANREE